jgi:hypothetical protein
MCGSMMEYTRIYLLRVQFHKRTCRPPALVIPALYKQSVCGGMIDYIIIYMLNVQFITFSCNYHVDRIHREYRYSMPQYIAHKCFGWK